MIRVLNRGYVPAMKGWEQGFIAQNTVGGPHTVSGAQQSVYRDVHLKNENLI